jgi:hypothetical protein
MVMLAYDANTFATTIHVPSRLAEKVPCYLRGLTAERILDRCAEELRPHVAWTGWIEDMVRECVRGGLAYHVHPDLFEMFLNIGKSLQKKGSQTCM